MLTVACALIVLVLVAAWIVTAKQFYTGVDYPMVM